MQTARKWSKDECSLAFNMQTHSSSPLHTLETPAASSVNVRILSDISNILAGFLLEPRRQWIPRLSPSNSLIDPDSLNEFNIEVRISKFEMSKFF